MKIDVYTRRINEGMSQQQLADQIGVSVDVIRNLEANGSRPRLDNARLVAQHYGISVAEMWPIPQRSAA
jgi:transcriptional regulator with XRE-family HTH domain